MRLPPEIIDAIIDNVADTGARRPSDSLKAMQGQAPALIHPVLSLRSRKLTESPPPPPRAPDTARMFFLDVALIFCVLLGVVVRAVPSDQTFEWWFSGPQAQTTSLPTCRTFPMGAGPRKSHGVPPFYMIAVAVGGAPITSFIGTNESDLSWTVSHPLDSQLVLWMVDSQGNSGGVPSQLYTVTAGASTQCISSPTAPTTFTVKANVSDAVNTCQPWGLTISGGTPPYNVTLAASPGVTNVTLGPNDSVFTYINRADPGNQMIAAVSDFNGQWATGSPMVRTQGSTDVNCTGLVSSGGTGTPPDEGRSSSKNHSLSRTRIGLIAGVSVAALIMCGAAVCCHTLPRIEDGRETSTPSESQSPGTPLFIPQRFTPARTSSPKTLTQSYSCHTLPRIEDGRQTSAPSESQSPGTPLFTPQRFTPARTSPKTLTCHTLPRGAAPPVSPPPSSRPVVRELPPPYPQFLQHSH
ncbi:hypothetical protein C8J57DRAFT_1722471 [Mycena rebaudengoi]|nr:hypothetical protein C8J57DRAFT_1722471 [Mycena rebaudengoi]